MDRNVQKLTKIDRNRQKRTEKNKSGQGGPPGEL